MQQVVQGFGSKDVDALRQELRALRQRNLKEASFEEKADLVATLGIRVFPSEDLKSRRIACRLNLQTSADEREQGDNDFAKVVYGEPWWIRTSDTLIKRLGNGFRLQSPFLNLTTADLSGESGCHFSSPRQSIIALFW